jgi:ribosomal subunit interface protein
MEISIKARHGKLPESIRKQAHQRLSRMERFDRRLTSATLVVDIAANGHTAEARIAPAGGPPLIGHTSAPTMRAAIDGALDRVERQLRRRSERKVARRTRAGAAVREPVMP